MGKVAEKQDYRQNSDALHFLTRENRIFPPDKEAGGKERRNFPLISLTENKINQNLTLQIPANGQKKQPESSSKGGIK